MLLLQRDATVTICHSKTPDLAAVAARADILVAAIGRPGVRDAGVREAGRDGDRRRHDPVSAIAHLVERIFGAGSRAARRVRSARHGRRRRRASRRRGGRRRADAGARRRRPADDRDAAQEHARRRDGACLPEVEHERPSRADAGSCQGPLEASARADAARRADRRDRDGEVVLPRGDSQRLGVPVIDADLLAREAVAPDTPGLRAIVARFGPAVLPPTARSIARRSAGSCSPTPARAATRSDRPPRGLPAHPRVVREPARRHARSRSPTSRSSSRPATTTTSTGSSSRPARRRSRSAAWWRATPERRRSARARSPRSGRSRKRSRARTT